MTNVPSPPARAGRDRGGPLPERMRTGLAAALVAARKELAVVIALLVAAVALLAFLSVTDAVVDGHTVRFDLGLLRLLRRPGDMAAPIGPAWLKASIIDFTALGSITVLTVVVLIVAGLFAAIRRWREAAMLIIASLTGVALVGIFKDAVDRSRPPLFMHVIPVTQASFPSGHAALSAIVYLTVATLSAHFAGRRRVRLYALVVGLVLTLLVGASRVYLGVHWPTDVIAGWAMGAAWATVWWLIAWGLEIRRGAPQSDAPLDKPAPR